MTRISKDPRNALRLSEDDRRKKIILSSPYFLFFPVIPVFFFFSSVIPVLGTESVRDPRVKPEDDKEKSPSSEGLD